MPYYGMFPLDCGGGDDLDLWCFEVPTIRCNTGNKVNVFFLARQHFFTHQQH